MFNSYNIPQVEVLNGLKDLSEFGIHLTNSRVHCIQCGTRIPSKYSSSLTLTGTCCSECTDAWNKRKVLNHDTMWVVKSLAQYNSFSTLHAIVKIDGNLYFARFYLGGTYQLTDIETGVEVHQGLIKIGSREIEAAYKSQKKLRSKEPAYVVQVQFWQLVDKVTRNLPIAARWLSLSGLNDVASNDPFRSRWVRLYVEPVAGSSKEFQLLDIQIVDTPAEAFLEKYFVTGRPIGKMQITWSQVKEPVISLLNGINIKYLTHEISQNIEKYKQIRESVTSDAWIAIDIGFYHLSSQVGSMAHEVEDVSIMPF